MFKNTRMNVNSAKTVNQAQATKTHKNISWAVTTADEAQS